jgi:hypothetical protein
MWIIFLGCAFISIIESLIRVFESSVFVDSFGENRNAVVCTECCLQEEKCSRVGCATKQWLLS